jgi:hypothetical protein
MSMKRSIKRSAKRRSGATISINGGAEFPITNVVVTVDDPVKRGWDKRLDDLIAGFSKSVPYEVTVNTN